MANRVVWSFHAMDKFSVPIQRMQQRVNKLKTNMNKLKTSMDRTATSIKKVGNSMKKFSAVAAIAVVGSLKAFGDMESGVTNVLTLLDDDQIDQFGGQIEKMASESLTKWGFGIEETTKALFDNVSALGTSQKSMDTFEAAQRLAIGGVTGLDVAVDGLTSIMNAYSDGTQTAEEVANSFFASQKAGKITVAELAFNVGKVAPIAKSAGIGYQELLATISQLTLGGLSAEEASTSLKGAITSLLKPSKESAAILAAEGIAFGASALGAQSLVTTLKQIAVLREKDEDLLIKAIPNIRGFTAVAALEANALANIEKTVGGMTLDQLTPAVDKQMETFNRTTAILWGNIKGLGITIGANLAPGFLFLAKVLQGAVKWFQGLSDKTKMFISWSLVAIAVLSTVVIAIGGLIGILGFGLAAVGATVAGFFGVLISIPALIVAAFIGAVAAIWIFWDDIKGLVNKVSNLIGFGDILTVEGKSDINTTSKHEIAVGITANRADIESVSVKSTGSASILKTGRTMD